MKGYFTIFGNHPRLSLAEINHVLPDKTSAPVLCGAGALFQTAHAWDLPVLMQRLGGTIKLGNLLGELSTKECTAETLIDLLPERSKDHKLHFGLTAYGGSASTRQKLERLAVPLKRLLTERGHSVRWVTSEDGGALTPAAVAKLNLINEGYDIVLLIHGEHVTIGLTSDVQNADAWSRRDYGRPVRDDENGMLPPKLARMMVNLAAVPQGGTLLDPFCGSGTVLMEAALATKAGTIYGSDVSDRQIAGTDKNITWLGREKILWPEDLTRFKTFECDAQRINERLQPHSIDCVVTEGSLGPPLSGHETLPTLERNVAAITQIWKKTLTSLHAALKPGGRIVAVWPSFKTSHGTARVDLTEASELRNHYEISNPLGSWDQSNAPLLYHRLGQRVMRRIVVLIKK